MRARKIQSEHEKKECDRKSKCHKQSSHIAIANTLSATCIIYRCLAFVIAKWTKKCLRFFSQKLHCFCILVFSCCSPVSFQYQAFSIFHSCRDSFESKHECLSCLEEIFQAIELSARAESFIKSKATDRLFWRALQSKLTMPYRTTTTTRWQRHRNDINSSQQSIMCNSLIYIWNVGDFTFSKANSMNTCRWISTQPFAT